MAYVVGILIGLVVGSAAVWLVLVSFTGSKLAAARRTRQLMLAEARTEADAARREAELEAKEAAVKHRAEVERELQSQRADALRDRERLHTREDDLNRRFVELERREQGITDRETHVKQLQDEFKDAKDREVAELERISSLTVNEAKGRSWPGRKSSSGTSWPGAFASSRRRRRPRPGDAPATSSPTPCSAWRRATPRRPPSRSWSSPRTT